MKIYLVGGAVRDKLLNLTVNERDYVVVGASTAEMMRLGYQQVGKEFPVFLHPQTREEYALARMERKTEPGYTGFKFDTSSEVTLEEDLLRRDLTINAMAEDEDGNIIDPFNGRADLDNRILRHVSPAFAEDPVRILRLGRFLARYAYLGFTVAPETTALMLDMVKDGEVNALVAERVWKELVRALTEKNPEKFFEVLSSCDANKILFPELTKAEIDALIVATTVTEQAVIRYATLLHRLNEHDVRAISARYRVPNAYRELAIFVRRHSQTALRCQQASADQLLNLFHALDIFRREPRFHDFLMACKIIAKYQNKAFSDEWLLSCALAAKSYDVQLLIQQGLVNKTLADALKQKRHEQIVAWLAKNR